MSRDLPVAGRWPRVTSDPERDTHRSMLSATATHLQADGDQEPASDAAGHARRSGRPAGSAPSGCEIEDVTFTYGSGLTALQGLTMTSSAKKTLGLVGPSGGGKR